MQQTDAFDDLIRPDTGRRDYAFSAVLALARVLLIVLAVVIMLWAPLNWWSNSRSQEELSRQTEEQGQTANREENKAKLAAARQYNMRIAASDQTRFGEVEFDKKQTKEKSEERGSALDKRYQSMLASDNDVMAVIKIPKISVKLPIYHGTSNETLARGAGHLYGSSLPVGGRSTNTVITAHRGMPDVLFFTRLGEMKRGDLITLSVLGQDLNYRVTAIHVVKPNDVHLYRVVPGKDLVTLMTCTPYGVNTERLVVVGERDNSQAPQQAHADATQLGTLVGILVGVLLLGWLLLAHRAVLLPVAHSDGTPLAPRSVLPWRLDNTGRPPLGLFPRGWWRSPSGRSIGSGRDNPPRHRKRSARHG